MDDIIEAVIDFVGTLLEEAFKSIKNPTRRKWALTLLYSAFLLAVEGFFWWGVWALAAEGNRTGAIVFAVIAAFLLLLFGALIIRGHRQNWKRKSED